MRSYGRLIVAATAMAALAGCMHRGVDNVSAGDVSIDSLSATRTAILRVQNGSASVVRVYMVMPGMQPNYVAKSMPGNTRSWVLDPNMFPAAAVSFQLRPESGTTQTVGPYKVTKNQTIDVVVGAGDAMPTAMVHASTP
jgi:hypothetical protein